jgi:indole-3-glycerol phosphate synthase
MSAATPDLLEAIVASARARVAMSEARRPRAVVERASLARPAGGAAFHDALSRRDRVNIIAECKRRSPSRGILRAAYDPVAIATGYERAGAAAISVLTEPGFFDGSLAHLEGVRAAVATPLLRKDFVVDEYQLLEAREAGANAVLLIVAALDDRTLARLAAAAADLGLAALVEVHTVEECDRALAAGARLIGVNNRNLRTLEVDLEASHEIAERLPRGVVAVSESGLKTAADLQRMTALGYRAFLIGERFMTAADPGGALAALLRSLAPTEHAR